MNIVSLTSFSTFFKLAVRSVNINGKWSNILHFNLNVTSTQRNMSLKFKSILYLWQKENVKLTKSFKFNVLINFFAFGAYILCNILTILLQSNAFKLTWKTNKNCILIKLDIIAFLVYFILNLLVGTDSKTILEVLFLRRLHSSDFDMQIVLFFLILLKMFYQVLVHKVPLDDQELHSDILILIVMLNLTNKINKLYMLSQMP